MPTYEYRCKACSHELEVQQSFSEDPLETCPECGGALRKVYGNVGISFKGSGFYKNDARPSATKSSSSKSSDDSSKGDSASKADAPSKTDSSTSGDSGSSTAAASTSSSSNSE